MTTEELENLLRLWGRIYGDSLSDVAELPEHVNAPDFHPLARGMRFAPGKRAVLIRRLTTMDRAGQARRRLMARDLGACGITIVPAAYVDPVPGSRSSRGGSAPPAQRPGQDVAERVQSAWLSLRRVEELRATVVQQEYQRRGMTQREKAAAMSIKLNRYRDELGAGKIWLHGRLTA